MICKKCLFEGVESDFCHYVKFFETTKITAENHRDAALPKYGYHLAANCPRCGNYVCFLPQNNENMLNRRFMAK
jgi:hypothetical protein